MRVAELIFRLGYWTKAVDDIFLSKISILVNLAFDRPGEPLLNSYMSQKIEIITDGQWLKTKPDKFKI